MPVAQGIKVGGVDDMPGLGGNGTDPDPNGGGAPSADGTPGKLKLAPGTKGLNKVVVPGAPYILLPKERPGLEPAPATTIALGGLMTLLGQIPEL